MVPLLTTFGKLFGHIFSYFLCMSTDFPSSAGLGVSFSNIEARNVVGMLSRGVS